MYYPIIKAKRHELKAASQLSSIIGSNKFRPVIEPVNLGLAPLAKTIDVLSSAAIIPIVVINPTQGEYSSSPAIDVYFQLQNNKSSANKFLPCIKVKNSYDLASLQLLDKHPTAAVYFESNISASSIAKISESQLVLANPQKNEAEILSKIKSLVLYTDSFAKKKRNADYDDVSFYSNLHVTYKQAPNAIGFGDFTIMGEEYSGSGGPAYVVAIHVSHIEKNNSNAMYVRHFCSKSDSLITANTPGKYLEALKDLVAFDKSNPGVLDRTIGLKEFYSSYEQSHFPGLGLVKEMSIKHHIQTTCNLC